MMILPHCMESWEKITMWHVPNGAIRGVFQPMEIFKVW